MGTLGQSSGNGGHQGVVIGRRWRVAAAPKPAPLFRPSQGVRCQVFSVRQCQGQVPRWLFPMLAQPPDPLLTSLSHQQRAILTRTGRREIIIGRIIASSSLARGFPVVSPSDFSAPNQSHRRVPAAPGQHTVRPASFGKAQFGSKLGDEWRGRGSTVSRPSSHCHCHFASE